MRSIVCFDLRIGYRCQSHFISTNPLQYFAIRISNGNVVGGVCSFTTASELMLDCLTSECWSTPWLNINLSVIFHPYLRLECQSMPQWKSIRICKPQWKCKCIGTYIRISIRVTEPQPQWKCESVKLPSLNLNPNKDVIPCDQPTLNPSDSANPSDQPSLDPSVSANLSDQPSLNTSFCRIWETN